MTEQPAAHVPTRWDPDDDPSRETIALLQEEVARLEAELRARDEAPAPPAGAPDPSEADRALARRVEELTAEVAARDETVNLLLEQTRLFEEAAAAQRAEWEQLGRWVEEVERRVDGRDGGADQLRDDLRAERARADAARAEAEAGRRDWEARRAGLEREVEQLRGLLAAGATGSPGGDAAALASLRDENQRLRAACAEPQRLASAEVDALRSKLAAAEAEREQARDALRRLDDERRRERVEHEAEVTALRSRLARESLATGPAPARPDLDPDERIRAFRQHLKELHDREAEERAGQSLSARLSRLWRHTGPGAS